MDFFSHLLWTAIVFRNQAPLWPAIFFGALPDLGSWGVYLFHLIKTGQFQLKKPNLAKIPQFVWTLYGLTHSVFSFAAVFAILSLINGAPFVPALAWIMHIAFDIPTHSRQFLATPFLWPLSDYKFPGIGWPTRWFIALNWGAIITLITYLFIIKGQWPTLF